jgi:diguanylate cyclase (GGDEF)-like protein
MIHYHGHRPRFFFFIVSLGLSLGAPIGWWVIVRFFTIDPASPWIYIYLTLGTATIFGFIGTVFGAFYQKLESATERDDLTGLFNQSAFMRTATVLHQLAIRHRESFSILMLDIDRFKDVNDKNNHLVGSYVLKQIARIIDRGVRRSDLSGRFGGDEFIFCLPKTGVEAAHLIADRLRREIEAETFVYGYHRVRVTVSIGVASCYQASRDVSLSYLIEKADEALYAAKNDGRNRVVRREVGFTPTTQSVIPTLNPS